MYEQNTSMMNIPEQNAFLLPAMVEGDFSSEEIAEDADGLQMMSFQRVKIPAGGQLQFEIPIFPGTLYYLTFSTISTSLHLLSFDRGLVSITFTLSPIEHTFSSSCAFSL